MTEVRLLGQVELRASGELLDLGPPKQRVLFAALAVDAGRSVPVSTLIDRMWDEHPPAEARNALYGHIMRVRRVLAQATEADGSPLRLDRCRAGYLLAVDRDRVDLHRFRHLVEQAREPGLGDVERVTLLREALGLWRGTPLDGLGGSWAIRMREGCRRQRVDAVVAWARLELRLGNHETVIGPVRDVLDDHPLVEPLTAVLMRALRETGRVAEALDCYVSIGSRLVAELGVDPGPELQQLHLEILNAGPPPRAAPDVSAVAAPVVAGPPPRQLPLDVSTFVHRDRELARLGELLAAGHPTGPSPVVVIHGAPGAGKSALAVRAANLLSTRFPDGQLYLNLHGATPEVEPLSPADGLGRFLRALGVAAKEVPQDVEEAGALFRTLVADRRILILLDNAATVAQVRPLLAGSGVLVTSRVSLATLDGSADLHLGPLTADAAREMLDGLIGVARTAADPDATRRLAELCDHLPSGLHMAASRLRARPNWSIAHLVDHLADERYQRAELATGDLAVGSGLSVSHAALQAHAEVLRQVPTPTVGASAPSAPQSQPVATAAGRPGTVLSAETSGAVRLAVAIGTPPSASPSAVPVRSISGETNHAPVAHLAARDNLGASDAGANCRHGERPREHRQPAQPGEPEAPNRAEVLVPQQLPPAVAHFAGRRSQLEVLARLADRSRKETGTVVISAVSGTAGVGKTALALHWAHKVSARFPDGQLYVNLRGFDPAAAPMRPAQAVRYFLDALQIPAKRIPIAADAQAALYRSVVAGRRLLVVLDNARDTAQVRPLLPGTSGCLVLVTSRDQLSGLVAAEGAQPIALDVLTASEARQLLTLRLGHQRVASEPQAVQDIIVACARLPLALVIVAARVATHPQLPLQTIAAELVDSRSRLDRLTDGDPGTDLRAVLSWSYRTLTRGAMRLFRLLSLHPGPGVSAAAAASLAGAPAQRLLPLLIELTRANMLMEHAPGRYSVHDLLRVYAAELAYAEEPESQRRLALQRLLDHYLQTAYTAARLLNPHRDVITCEQPAPEVTPERPATYEQALAWFTTEHGVLMAAVAHAADSGLHRHAWQLAWTLTSFFDWQGHWHDHVIIGKAAVAAAHHDADPAAQAISHRLLGFAYLRLGRIGEADEHLRLALELYERIGNSAGQANTYHVSAQLRDKQGRTVDALEHAYRALHLFEAAGHQRGHALALNTVGWYQAVLGRHQEALTACQQALALLSDLEDRDGQAHTWDSLGFIHHHLGHYPEAIDCYQRALDLAGELGDRYTEADTLIHLGDTHLTAGNPTEAHGAWRRALTIFDDFDHPDAALLRSRLFDGRP